MVFVHATRPNNAHHHACQNLDRQNTHPMTERNANKMLHHLPRALLLAKCPKMLCSRAF